MSALAIPSRGQLAVQNCREKKKKKKNIKKHEKRKEWQPVDSVVRGHQVPDFGK